jgi:hypothetical protein
MYGRNRKTYALGVYDVALLTAGNIEKQGSDVFTVRGRQYTGTKQWHKS